MTPSMWASFAGVSGMGVGLYLSQKKYGWACVGAVLIIVDVMMAGVR